LQSKYQDILSVLPTVTMALSCIVCEKQRVKNREFYTPTCIYRPAGMTPSEFRQNLVIIN